MRGSVDRLDRYCSVELTTVRWGERWKVLRQIARLMIYCKERASFNFYKSFPRAVVMRSLHLISPPYFTGHIKRLLLQRRRRSYRARVQNGILVCT